MFLSSPTRDRDLSGAETSCEECESTENVRVLSYNLHGWRDSDHNDNFERVGRIVADALADVICLQEVLHPYSAPSDPSYFRTVREGNGKGYTPGCVPDEADSYLAKLAKLAGMPFYAFADATQDGYFGRYGFGNAILSRHPIVSERRLVLEPDARHQRGRRIEAESRVIVCVELELRMRRQWFASLHLDQLSDELRFEQLDAMLRFARSRAGPLVLCGDFNAFSREDCSSTAWRAILDDAAANGWSAPPETTRARETMRTAGYSDCFWAAREGASREIHSPPAPPSAACIDKAYPGATCWVKKPLLRIDYVYACASVLRAGFVQQYGRIRNDASDHFPVFVDMVLAAAAADSSDSDEAAHLCAN